MCPALADFEKFDFCMISIADNFFFFSRISKVISIGGLVVQSFESFCCHVNVLDVNTTVLFFSVAVKFYNHSLAFLLSLLLALTQTIRAGCNGFRCLQVQEKSLYLNNLVNKINKSLATVPLIFTFSSDHTHTHTHFFFVYFRNPCTCFCYM